MTYHMVTFTLRCNKK